MPALTAVQIKVTVVDDVNSQNIYTSYTLPNTPFYLTPIWIDTGKQTGYSQYQILWEFGDGTTYVGPSASHYYKYPGIYSVQATFYDANGNPYTVTSSTDTTSASNVHVSLTAINAMPDLITFDSFTPSNNAGIYALPAGKKSEPLKIYRYNSWQNDKFLSQNNYTINLYASGSKSNFLSPEEYYSDKYSHLRQYFTFVDTTIDNGIVVSKLVDSTYTSSVSVYAEKFKFDGRWDIGLNFYPYPKNNTAFAGTTGTTIDNHFVSYIDQTPDDEKSTDLIFIYAHPDTRGFYDFVNLYENYYPSFQFPIQGYINYPKWRVQYLKSIFNPAKNIAITSNGITVEGTEQTLGPLSGQFIHSFNIYPIKWVDSDISFCCTFKDDEQYTTKCYPPITGFKADGTDPTELNTISLGVYKVSDLDPFTPIAPISSSLITTATFKQNPFVPMFTRHGSYFCGLVSIPEETQVAVLCAAALILDQPPLNLGVPYGFAGQPGLSNIKRFSKRPIFSNCSEEEVSFSYRGENATYTTSQNSNLILTYAPLGTYNRGQDRVIIADPDNDKLYFYTVSGTEILSLNLNNFPVYAENASPYYVNLKGNLNSSSPSNIATDSLGNIWVSLYDAVSCIKIDYNTFTATAYAVPTLRNVDYTNTFLYFTLKNLLSGFTGENSLLPTCLDTDPADNIFVGYSHPVSGFIFKYNSTGQVLTAAPITPLHSLQEIIVDRTGSVWGIAKQLNSGHSTDPFAVTDIIYRWDGNLELQQGFPLQTLKNIGNATIDLKQNLWVNTDFSKITRVDVLGNSITFDLGSQTNSTGYFQPIGGVACDAEGYVWIIHNYNGKIYFYPTDLQQYPLSGIYSGDLPGIQYTTPDGSRAFYNVFGDWTGIRWINKYVSGVPPLPRIIRGSSSFFKILKQSPVINKINENFDQASTYKSYILQESLFDKKILLDDFLGQIVGDVNSQPTDLGKTVYEKIANFVSNNADPEVCTLRSLRSLHNQYALDYKDFVSEYPPGLRRVADLLSINQRKLFGSPSFTTYDFGLSAFNFNIGKNLGDEIDISTGKFIVGEPIVTFEKFSEKYKIIYNTVVPVTNNMTPIVGQLFPLSGINYSWGWGLVTGTNAQSGVQIEPYYRFYKYRPNNSIKMVDGVIDFNNPQTTITPFTSSYENWTEFAGGMETVISRAMYNGLEL